MTQIAAFLGAFLAPILTPIIKGAMRELFKELSEERAVVSMPNAALQRMWENTANPARDGDAVGKTNPRGGVRSE